MIRYFLCYWLSAFVLAFASSCPPPLRSRQLTFMPQIYFATVTSRGVGGASADLVVNLPFPCSKFFVVSNLNVQDSLFFHLTPLGKVYAGNAIVANGTENWFPLTAFPVATGAPWFWSVINIPSQIKQFYLDMGQEAGGANTVTIACIANGDEFDVGGGPWGV